MTRAPREPRTGASAQPSAPPAATIEEIIARFKGPHATRMAAVRDATRIGAAAVWPLRRALRDENDAIRAGALLALGRLARPPLLPLLVQHLKDRRSVVRFAARRALLDFGPEAVPALGRFLMSPSVRVRAGVIAILREFNGVGPLLQALDHRSARTRLDTVRALAAVGSPRATPSLIRVLEEDAADEVRRAAAWVLLEMADGRAIAPLRRGAGALGLTADARFEERALDAFGARWSGGEPRLGNRRPHRRRVSQEHHRGRLRAIARAQQ